MVNKPPVKIHVRHRGLIQLFFAVLTNSFITGFIAGKIYKGDLKRVCAPGLNCYSCPGALLACPIGALQAVISSRAFNISLYVGGFLLLVGATLGRFVCGFLCPFGMIQEWLYKIPFPFKKNHFKGDRLLRYLKYVLLVVLVILLPTFMVNATGTGSPTFCKYVCPAGTLEGAIPLVLLSGSAPSQGVSSISVLGLPGASAELAFPQLQFDLPGNSLAPQYDIGFLFYWKMFILIAVVLLSVINWRPFCKYLCPLGAIYGLMNPISLYRLQMDESLCIHCHKCAKACKTCLDPEHKQNEAECVRCGDCVKVCPTGALSLGFGDKKTNTVPANPRQALK